MSSVWQRAIVKSLLVMATCPLIPVIRSSHRQGGVLRNAARRLHPSPC